jgi:hypothetical protein
MRPPPAHRARLGGSTAGDDLMGRPPTAALHIDKIKELFDTGSRKASCGPRIDQRGPRARRQARGCGRG